MEDQGGSSISPEYLNSGEAFPTSYFDFMPEDNDDELVPGVSIGEEKVEMFMQELYKEMNTASSSGDDVIIPSTWTAEQQPTTLMFRGWERRSESCGAAVSDSSSTVMAGVEFAGKLVSPALEISWRCGCKCGSYGGGLVANGEGGGEIEGCGGCGSRGDREMDGEDEEEWLAKVMNWGPADLVPGFWNDVHGGSSSEDLAADQSLDQVE